MDYIKANAHLTTILVLLFACFLSNAKPQDNPLVKAIQLFDAEDFEQAEQILKKLLDENPDHLMVNYYYGACRTENKNYGSNEIVYLLNGSTGEAPLKTNYYLGVQYHAKNRFEEAIKHYTKYQGTSTEEERTQLQLSEKIQQCYDKINPFVKEKADVAVVMPAPLPRETELEEFNPVIAVDSASSNDSIVMIDSLNYEKAEASTEKPIASATPKPSFIDFVIDGELTYLDSTHFRTRRGLTLYNNAKEKEAELNRKMAVMEKWRDDYGAATSYSEKQEIGEKILEGETEIYEQQLETKQLFSKAKTAELEYWQKASKFEKNSFKAELNAYAMDYGSVQKIAAPELDTSTVIDPSLLLVGADELPEMETSTNEDLVYKIQLGAYSRGLPSYVKRLFDKLSYIRKIDNYTDEKGVVVYTTGKLNNYEDALKMQNQVRREGVQDAFVASYFNGKRITLKEAKEIEAGK